MSSGEITVGDWRRVHIPSNDVLEVLVVAFTAFERRRSTLELWVADDHDLDHVTGVLVTATADVEGVLADSEPRPRLHLRHAAR